MEAIDLLNEFVQLDWMNFLTAVIILLALVAAVLVAISKISEFVGKPIKMFRRTNQDHELLIKTSENLIALQDEFEKSKNASIQNDELIKRDIEKLTSMFVDKEIDDYRWDIINLADKISDGGSCNKDSFTHCFSVYSKYEKILNEYNMENHEVDVSMDIINEEYKRLFG